MAGHTESDSEADAPFDDYLTDHSGGHESNPYADYEAGSQADGAVSEHSVDSEASDIASEHSSEFEEADSELSWPHALPHLKAFLQSFPSPLQSPTTESSRSSNDLVSYASSEDEAIPNPPSLIPATKRTRSGRAVQLTRRLQGLD